MVRKKSECTTPVSAANKINNNKTPTTTSKPSQPSISDLHAQIQSQQEEIERLSKFVDAQASHIVSIEENCKNLQDRITENERAINFNSSLLAVKDVVIERLTEDLNRCQQFMRRPCVNIVGLPKPKDESHDMLKEKIHEMLLKTNGAVAENDVDKFHRDGPSNQDVIIRFKTHTAKERFYENRKKITGDSYMKVRPLLTEGTKNLLKRASEAIQEYEKEKNKPEFVLPDVHGNLLVKMQHKSRVGLFLKFSNLSSLCSQVMRAQELEASVGFKHYEECYTRFDNSNAVNDDVHGNSW